MIDGCFDRSSCRKLSWGWAASTWSRWFPTLPPLSVRNWERVIASWLLTASAWSVWSTTCKYTEYCTQYTVWSLPVSVCSHLSVFSSQRQRTDPIIGRLAQTSGGQDRLKAEWEELGCDQMLKDELRWTIKCNWEYGTDGRTRQYFPTDQRKTFCFSFFLYRASRQSNPAAGLTLWSELVSAVPASSSAINKQTVSGRAPQILINHERWGKQLKHTFECLSTRYSVWGAAPGSRPKSRSAALTGLLFWNSVFKKLWSCKNLQRTRHEIIFLCWIISI